MKKLKIICFIMYLLSSVILIIPISFQNSIADNHDSFLIFYLIIYLIIITITVINSVILAKKLNRSEFGWGIFSFFMPYLSCVKVVLMKVVLTEALICQINLVVHAEKVYHYLHWLVKVVHIVELIGVPKEKYENK